MLNLHLLVKVGVWVTPAFGRRYIEFYFLNSILPLHSVLFGSIIAPSVPTIMSSSIFDLVGSPILQFIHRALHCYNSANVTSV